MPPWIWPSTSVGLIARPTSWAATIRRTVTVPSSRSTSTTAICAPNAYVSYGIALPVGVERPSSSGRTCRAPGARSRARRPAARRSSRIETRRRRPAATIARRAVDLERRLRSGLGEGQQPAPQVLGGEPGRVPRDERLARGRGLAGVGREVGVGRRRRSIAATGTPRASAAIWARTVLEPWPMSVAPENRTTVPSRGRPTSTSTGWAATCCRCRTTWPRCRRRAGGPGPAPRAR